ncbi:hypothetical protein LR48_Vigan246s000900 [Vigna angularis]|uniref:Uncharacterized protein n=1 Tax=Phaseolus angularis TaxID=3914 RepID=A0A0L9T7D5_PHAAN|nr:hypothetical protein LR48_Vigan246s000900 [Vigna angularis]
MNILLKVKYYCVSLDGKLENKKICQICENMEKASISIHHKHQQSAATPPKIPSRNFKSAQQSAAATATATLVSAVFQVSLHLQSHGSASLHLLGCIKWYSELRF